MEAQCNTFLDKPFVENSTNSVNWGLRRKPTQKGILGPTLAERLT